MLRKAYLEITNICNLACKFCPGTRRAKKFMTPGEFCFLAARLRPHTEYLYLHLMGEPLLHPHLGEILAIAHELRFKVMLTTNGTLLSEKGDIVLNCPAVHKVNISLQSFEANSRGILQDYVNRCADFASKCSAAGKICTLRLWNHNGYETMNGEIESILEAHFAKPWRESRSSMALGERIWLEPGDMFDWPDMGAQDMGDRCFCYGLRDQIGVLCDGTVVPCCLDHEGDIALGNLFESELCDIMSTEHAKNIYNGFSGRRASEELCRRCGYARRFNK